MMGPQVLVTQNVIVDVRVLARSEVPGFVFGVVFTAFKTLEFVLKVKDVVGLLISQRSVLKK